LIRAGPGSIGAGNAPAKTQLSCADPRILLMTDWDGEGYARISDLQRTIAGRTLARLRLDGDERCLDIGCGDGYLTKLIAARLPHGSVVGVDASPRMVEVARSTPVPPGAAVEFVEGSATDLGFDAAFDLAVSFNALHWVADEAGALRSIATAIRPGGRAVLQLVCAGPRESVEAVAMRVCADDRWASYFAGFRVPFVHPDPEAYVALAAPAGLAPAGHTVVDEEWRFADARAFRDWCAVGFADWTARLPADRAGDWVDQVALEYGTITGDPALFRFYQLVAEFSRDSAEAT
jgi:trans-aconitate 2-methyltransferase